MWLAWEIAAAISLLCVAVWIRLRFAEGRPAQLARPFAIEFALMFGLYALWRLAGRISVINPEGAFTRGQQLWNLERLLLLPDEATVQAWVLPNTWLVQAANIYYATVHVPAIIVCLAWLFIRHRSYYHVTRNNLALVTGASLLIQLVAVAPPRFLSDIGIVDTAVLYNQSVFSSLGMDDAGQLQAMPSIHVGWALIVGVATWVVGTGWVRRLGFAHAVVTIVVVTITGNHYWLDGVVAGLLLTASIQIQALYSYRVVAGSTPVEPVIVEAERWSEAVVEQSIGES